MVRAASQQPRLRPPGTRSSQTNSSDLELGHSATSGAQTQTPGSPVLDRSGVPTAQAARAPKIFGSLEAAVIEATEAGPPSWSA